MFHGVVADHQKPAVLFEGDLDVPDFEVTRAVLVGGSSEKETILYAKTEEAPRIALAILTKQTPQTELNCAPFTGDVKFEVDGPGSVHISGALVIDDDDDMCDDESESEEEEGAFKEGPEGIEKMMKDFKARQLKQDDEATDEGPTPDASSPDASSDEDDEDDDDKKPKKVVASKPGAEEGSSSSDDNDDEDAEDDDSDVDEEFIKKMAAAAKNKVATGSEDSSSEEEESPAPKKSNKRSSPTAAAPEPASKKDKKEKIEKTESKPTDKKASSTGSKDEETLKDAVMAYLKKNGTCTIGQLGAKVSKPQSLKQIKWGQFLKNHSCFKVNGQNVALAN